LVGTDEYPKKDKNDAYLIAGSDKDDFFKAKNIEFYGVKKQN
jgi:hypothetical protein